MALNKNDSFFPRTRKELFLTSITALANSAGEKRLKLGITMPMMDGKLVGMPEWLSEPFIRVQKSDLGVESVKSIVELDGMTLRMFSTDQSEEPILELPGALLKSFIVRRVSNGNSSGEVSDAELAFQIYTTWNRKVWNFGWTHFHSTCFCNFISTQASLSFGAPVKEADDNEEESDDEAASLQFGDGEDNEDSPAAQAKRRGRPRKSVH